MHAVSVLVFLALAGLVWHHLARGRQREERAAHRAFRAEQARFWAARLQADDARHGGGEEADARLHECARLLGGLRRRAADLPAACADDAAAVERFHAAQEELRWMQDSMLRVPLEAAERRRIREHAAGLPLPAGSRGGPGARQPGPAPRYGEPDALELGIRFAFGFFFGLGLAFLLVLRQPLAGDGANLLVLGATAGVCGLLATRFGDHFWFWISDNLWWMRR
ncbi:MAG TPA: hypothetical protein VK399_15510 [Longimicrobiaceae bacterium]|nr:hypothetical protein [Longimicrobiaceae bacterium]